MNSTDALDVPATWTFKSDEVVAHFDGHVRSQLPWYDILSSYVAEVLVSFVPTNGRVYDIGASTGNISRMIEAACPDKRLSFISIEPSREMSGKWSGKGALWTIDAENIDYSNSGSPDVAVMFLTLMFVKPGERKNLIEKVLKSINPGGAVMIVDKGYIKNPIIQVACKAAQLAGKRAAGTPADSYVSKEMSLRGEQRPTDPSGIVEIGEQYGFVSEEIFKYGEFYGLLMVKASI